jgi:hypothetical protein
MWSPYTPLHRTIGLMRVGGVLHSTWAFYAPRQVCAHLFWLLVVVRHLSHNTCTSLSSPLNTYSSDTTPRANCYPLDTTDTNPFAVVCNRLQTPPPPQPTPLWIGSSAKQRTTPRCNQM